MLHPHTLTFLTGLAGFNDKRFFNLNIELYKRIQKDFKKFGENIIKRISEFDSSIEGTLVKDCTFRINRDIRFSKEKTPYKTNLGIFIANGGKKSIFPGYYVHIQPGKNMFGGGVFYPSTENAYKIRQYIYENYAEFEKIIKSKDFKTNFKDVHTYQPSLKKVPKGYQADHPGIKYILYKDWLAGDVKFKDEEVLSDSFEDKIIEYSKKLYVLNKFLYKALV